MIVHPIHMHTSGLEHYVMSDAQVINIPFKCIEGDFSPHWGSWHTLAVEDVNITDQATGGAIVHM